MTLLDTNKNIIKTNKLALITEIVLSLDELDNTDNLEDRNLSNMLLKHHVLMESLRALNQLCPSITDLKTGSSFP